MRDREQGVTGGGRGWGSSAHEIVAVPQVLESELNLVRRRAGPRRPTPDVATRVHAASRESCKTREKKLCLLLLL